MIELFMERRMGALRPACPVSEEEFDALPQGKRYRVKITQDRSGPMHRLFFSMVGMVAKGCGRKTEDLLDIIKIATGHTRKLSLGGKWYEVPDSIAWHNMDQRKFNAFFEVACQVIEEEVGIRQPELMRELREQFPDVFGEAFAKENAA